MARVSVRSLDLEGPEVIEGEGDCESESEVSIWKDQKSLRARVIVRVRVESRSGRPTSLLK